jgi:hypothetical protein
VSEVGKTPVEQAGRAVAAHALETWGLGVPVYLCKDDENNPRGDWDHPTTAAHEVAQAAVLAAVSDLEGLARVLLEHAAEIWSLGDVECSCRKFESRIDWEYGETSAHRSRNLDAHREHVAREIFYYLTGRS